MPSDLRLVRKNAGTSHSYLLDGHPVPGVTTAIGVLDKPALVSWAARESASYAVENWDALAQRPIVARAKEIEEARWKSNRAATTKGTRVHAMAEQLLRGEEVTPPAEYRGQVEAYAKFLDEWDMEHVAAESPVAHTEWRYAGTFDAIMRSPKLGTVLLDVKTGKGVYDEVALQLAAYRFADYRTEMVEEVGPRGGKKSVAVERPVVEVDQCVVAHVLGDSVELVPITAGEDEFESFLHCLELFESWVKTTAWKYRESDAHRPRVGEPIWPEGAQA